MLSVLLETPTGDRLQYVFAVLRNKMLVDFLLHEMEQKEQAARRVGWRSLSHQINLEPGDTAKMFVDLLRGLMDSSIPLNEEYLQEVADGGLKYGVNHRFMFLCDLIIHRAWVHIYASVSHNPCLAELDDEKLLLHLKEEVDVKISTAKVAAVANPCTAENPCNECLRAGKLYEELKREGLIK